MRHLLSILALLLIGCLPAGDGGDEALFIFAAASTTDVVSELADRFEAARVRTSFGPTSSLARQIADGAPADVFVSASRRWVEHLQEKGLVIGEAQVFARNRLVCIAPAGSRFVEAAPTRVGELILLLKEGERVAIADENVPAGDYARESLRATGDLGKLRPFLVGQSDVRAVLRAVESGEAVAGFVYTTDARVADVEVLFAFDPGTHRPIEYFALVPTTSERPEQARRFLDFLRSSEALEVLRTAGFEAAEQ